MLLPARIELGADPCRDGWLINIPLCKQQLSWFDVPCLWNRVARTICDKVKRILAEAVLPSTYLCGLESGADLHHQRQPRILDLEMCIRCGAAAFPLSICLVNAMM